MSDSRWSEVNGVRFLREEFSPRITDEKESFTFEGKEWTIVKELSTAEMKKMITEKKEKEKKKKTSKWRGVSWYKPKECWIAQICYQSKQRFIGYYNDEEEAAKGYDQKSRELRGENANRGRFKLNFP